MSKNKKILTQPWKWFIFLKVNMYKMNIYRHIQNLVWREHFRTKKLIFDTPVSYGMLRTGFSTDGRKSSRATDAAMSKPGVCIPFRQITGLVIAAVCFAMLLVIPPTGGMYVEATKVVLNHAQEDVVQELLRRSNMEGKEHITSETIENVVTAASTILVSVPPDFSKSGSRGIALSAEGQPLSAIITVQATAIRNTMALAVLMAILWISEALPIPIVALLPMVFFPLLRIAHFSRAALPGYFPAFSPYMHYLVVLFIGGFTIAEAMKKWGLHERIALHFIRLIGFSQKRTVLGLMVATALISMFVSNTATAAMMMPIALAIILECKVKPGKSNFALVLMLGIAYAASIGGIGTLIGTPPNVVLAGFLDTLLDRSITFAQWLVIGLPLVAVLLPVTWLLLMKMNPMEKVAIAESREVITERIRALGIMRGGERNTFIIFIIVALLWISRKQWTTLLGLPWINDSVIAIIGVLLFYLIPVRLKKWEFTLDWRTNVRIPWGTLLLFGGGLALGQAMANTGAASFIAMHLVLLRNVPEIVILLLVVLLIDFLTEVTSNTATTNMMMPILFALGMALHRDPLVMMVAGAVAASMAFMLPVATPPNAIVFGTGYIPITKLVKNGFVLDLVAATTWTVLLYYVLRFFI